MKQDLPAVGFNLSPFGRSALGVLMSLISFGVAVFADRHRFVVTDHANSAAASKSEAETTAKEAAVEKLRISCRFQEQLPRGISVDLADYTIERTSCDQRTQNGTILYSCNAELKGFCEWSDSRVSPTTDGATRQSEVKEHIGGAEHDEGTAPLNRPEKETKIRITGHSSLSALQSQTAPPGTSSTRRPRQNAGIPQLERHFGSTGLMEPRVPVMAA